MTRQFDQLALAGRYLSLFTDARIADLGPAAREAARLPLRVGGVLLPSGA